MQEETKKAIKKLSLSAIIALAILLAVTVCYLIVSFVTKAWDTTWLIMVGGIFLGIVVFCGFTIAKFSKQHKYILPRISLAVSIILTFTFAFLAVIILTEISKSWILFLIMVIALIGADTVFAYWTDSKSRLIDLILFIQLASVLEYVILALVGLLSWHPYWFIPVVGTFINIAIIFIKFKDFSDKKKRVIEENNEVPQDKKE